MPTATEPYRITQDGWQVLVQPPTDPTARVVLLLHGFTGDETVMWIFTRALAGRFWLFAPRAPLAMAGGGFAWLDHNDQRWPVLDDFEAGTERLLSAFQGWAEQAHLPAEARQSPLHLMGFSQGAAMSYALAAYHPQRIGQIAALAGFFPLRAQPNPSADRAAFDGRSVYLAHGSRDEIVPIQMAHEAIQRLQAAGAEVTFCESDVGHKLAANCLRGIESFFG